MTTTTETEARPLRGPAYGGPAEAARLRRAHERAMPCTGCSHMDLGRLRTHPRHEGGPCPRCGHVA